MPLESGQSGQIRNRQGVMQEQSHSFGYWLRRRRKALGRRDDVRGRPCATRVVKPPFVDRSPQA